MNTQTQFNKQVLNLRPRAIKQFRFFPQVKSQGKWVNVMAVNKYSGYGTIEECQDSIDNQERTDIFWNVDREWRIKEELV